MTETGLWPQLRDYWLPAAFSEEVGEKPLAVRLLDERLALCRLGGRGGHGGEVAAFYDLCVHRGCPISLGWVEGKEVVCAYHG
jgi:vanillate O-demethylase monooxygenase subunit